ncbi:sortase, partial [Bacillus anthracis]
ELTYEVTGHEVILPSQVEKLAIIKGKDKATLLTCEPYTSSKYRLLVYGERVHNKSQENSTESMIKIKENQKQDFVKTISFIIIGILVIFIALFGLLRKN